MPVETKKTIKVYAILGAVIILVAAALAVLVMFLVTKAAAPTQTQPVQTTLETVPTEPTLPQSSYAVEDFVYDGDYLSCPTADTMLGIDVSHHQGQIDWAQVKSAGVEFVMVRLGYRGLSEGNLYTDDYALENLRGAREAGLLVGAYFYSQAVCVEEALEEAQYALQILGDFKLDLPLAYDWEQEKRTENVDVQTVTDCAMVFCEVVKNAGYGTMVYFNTYQARELMDLNRLTDYPWWLAMYSTDSQFPCRFDVWQYTCEGVVPGISGNVDVNVMLVDGQ